MIKDNTNSYCVYMHKNKINNKVYIGQTIHGDNPNVRWKNGYGYQPNTYIRNAINEYGWDNFEHIVLCNNLTKEQALELEIKYIKEYNSTNREFGYNITSGGEGATGLTGDKNPMFGISPQERMDDDVFEEWKKKISQRSRDRWINLSPEEYEAECKKRRGKNHPRCRKIYCPELDEYFSYINEAAQKYNISKSNIGYACKDWHFTAGKHPTTNEPLHWCYEEDMDKFYIPERRPSVFARDEEWVRKQRESHIGLLVGIKNPRSRSVYCVELNEIFWGSQCVTEKYGFDNSSIGKCCKGIWASCGRHPLTGEKLHWLYAEDAIKQGYISQQNLNDYLDSAANNTIQN